MRMLTNWVLLSLIIVTGWSFGQPSPPTTGKAKEADGKSAEAGKPAEPAEKSLETLMAQALRYNPDVLAAESKVREAEAELRRTKLVLALKITEQRIAVENQRQILAAAQEEYEMYLILWKQHAGSESNKRQAEQKMLLAKSQLASAEAALNTTAGILPKGIAAMTTTAGAGGPAGPSAVGGSISGGGVTGVWHNGGISGFTGSGISGGISGDIRGGISGGISGISGISGGISGGIGGGIGGNLGMLGGGAGGNFGALGGGFVPDVPPVRVPSATMADKVRKALDVTIKVKPIKEKPLADVVSSYRTAAGVPFLLQLGDKANVPVSFSLEGDVQLGSVFQALEDVMPELKCYIREYGILITVDPNEPYAMMPLIEFWQQKPGRK